MAITSDSGSAKFSDDKFHIITGHLFDAKWEFVSLVLAMIPSEGNAILSCTPRFTSGVRG